MTKPWASTKDRDDVAAAAPGDRVLQSVDVTMQDDGALTASGTPSSSPGPRTFAAIVSPLRRSVPRHTSPVAPRPIRSSSTYEAPSALSNASGGNLHQPLDSTQQDAPPVAGTEVVRAWSTEDA